MVAQLFAPFSAATTSSAGETTVTVHDGLGRTVMAINGEGHIQTIHRHLQ